jgi:hypothetical protein
MPEDNDAFSAGRLIQWAINVKAIPFNEPEYRELLDRYIDDSSFRNLVRRFADGLGLIVLESNDRGLFLGTQEGSVFAQTPSEFRGSRPSAEDRLLDGLVQVAIAATIYPRQQDLDENSLEAKRPVTVGEIDETLRVLCAEHKRRAAENPDRASDEIDQGLHEAWRVYESRPGIKMTAQGNLSPASMQSLIRRHMQFLMDHGCFVMSSQGDSELYRPTLRYQIQVKELAATKLYREIQCMMTDVHDNPERSAISGGANA